MAVLVETRNHLLFNKTSFPTRTLPSISNKLFFAHTCLDLGSTIGKTYASAIVLSLNGSFPLESDKERREFHWTFMLSCLQLNSSDDSRDETNPEYEP